MKVFGKAGVCRFKAVPDSQLAGIGTPLLWYSDGEFEKHEAEVGCQLQRKRKVVSDASYRFPRSNVGLNQKTWKNDPWLIIYDLLQRQVKCWHRPLRVSLEDARIVQ